MRCYIFTFSPSLSRKLIKSNQRIHFVMCQLLFFFLLFFFLRSRATFRLAPQDYRPVCPILAFLCPFVFSPPPSLSPLFLPPAILKSSKPLSLPRHINDTKSSASGGCLAHFSPSLPVSQKPYIRALRPLPLLPPPPLPLSKGCNTRVEATHTSITPRVELPKRFLSVVILSFFPFSFFVLFFRRTPLYFSISGG